MSQASRIDHNRAPYAEALDAHARRDTLALMVPGHGGTGFGAFSDLAWLVGERALAMDIPPLIEGIDVGDDSPLVHAQRLAADAWGARRTWFLANGASQANRMAAYALSGLGRGNTVLAQRSAHSSFTDGVILGDLSPRFVFPSIDRDRGINHGVSPACLEAALSATTSEDTPVAAVYIISPSYFGAVADVAGLAEVAHRYGAPLVVDGAWGAHFGFHPELPGSPARLGADLVVSSTHKLGGSLTQSAMLHLGEGLFADALEPLLDRALMITQSTSPSALLLGSLDIARRSLMRDSDLIGETIVTAERLRDRLRADGRLPVISDGFDAYPDIIDHDPMRVAVDVSGTGLSGHRVREILGREHGIFLELSTATAVVAFIGAGKAPDVDRFADALISLVDAAGDDTPAVSALIPELPAPGPLTVAPRAAYFGAHEIVPAAAAVGRVSADSLAAYPPGIPNVIPGETITAETVAFLQAVAASPIGYVRGAIDSGVQNFRVLVQP